MLYDETRQAFQRLEHLMTMILSQGGPTGAMIAKANRHVSVTVVDLNESQIASWNSSQLPIFEPGLMEIVEVARDGTDGRTPNLHFSTDVPTAITLADVIFICVNTPTKRAGLGAGSAADLTYVEQVARRIAEVAKSDKIIVEKSTVPCGTAESLRNIFAALAPSIQMDVLSNPEFLAEGTAINDLLCPDRILIGSLQDSHSAAAADVLAALYSAWVPRERIITINIWSSELAKLAANCMLAQRISSINSFSAICEATGADIEELSYVIGLDQRIGSKMLKASVGFGGSCFKKDVLMLCYLAESLHLPEVARYWRSVVDVNEYQKHRFTQRILAKLHNTLKNKKVAILGLAYKKNTGDTRESAAITIIHQLLAENAEVAVYDPQVSEKRILQDLEAYSSSAPVEGRVHSCTNAITACTGASAVVILTEWDYFKTDRLSVQSRIIPGEKFLKKATTSPVEPIQNGVPYCPQRLDWCEVAGVMKRPRLIFDGRNLVDHAKLATLGFELECIGKRGLDGSL